MKYKEKKLIIAIDGPAASGKSSSAKQIAELFSYTYIDTGAMYRATALAATERKISFNNTDKLSDLLDNITIDFQTINGKQRTYLNGKDVSERIRDAEITKLSSSIAVIPIVRERLVKMQQDMGKMGGVVMDGRDIGTVVFPNADFKFFLNASLEIRAYRRWKEMKDKKTTLEEVEKELIWRDFNDSTRDISPLQKAADAIEIDTTNMTVEEQTTYMVQMIERSEPVLTRKLTK